MSSRSCSLAVVGDIHDAWVDADAHFFNHSDYDAVLFVGDLPRLRLLRNHYRVARRIARVEKPAFLIPGNHDATALSQLIPEVTGRRHLQPFGSRRQRARVAKLARTLGRVTLCGYSSHTLDPANDLGLVAARPHSMGGGLNFAPYLNLAFGVDTMAASAERLCALVDRSPHRRLLFLAHNGPSGLGDRPGDIYGQDFRGDGGDWGDPDLRRAVDHALAQGREVVAVVAGHMHHETKSGDQRPFLAQRDGITYVNAARCPRIFRSEGRRVRYHVALRIDDDGCRATEVLVAE